MDNPNNLIEFVMFSQEEFSVPEAEEFLIVASGKIEHFADLIDFYNRAKEVEPWLSSRDDWIVMDGQALLNEIGSYTSALKPEFPFKVSLIKQGFKISHEWDFKTVLVETETQFLVIHWSTSA